MMNKLIAKVDANLGVGLNPTRSQTVLFTVCVIAALPMIGSFYLLVYGVSEWFWFLIVSLLMYAGTYKAWTRSQPDTDLVDAHPITITRPDGVTLQADSRVLIHPASAKAFGRLITETADRKPLPKPNGVVDDQLNPIPNSQHTAQVIADEVNVLVQEIEHHVMGQMNKPDDSSLHYQDTSKIIPPPR